ncbi:Hsp70 family protein [Eubacterium ramulus]|uniref:Hsp70 family protein n=1 Tax=Eubacterium ramulus TaxID=39490 RepID=UPI0035227735
MAILGIDLGTTNSLGAVYRNGKVELIPNRFGSFLTPSVVSVTEDGSVVTGQIAKERLITHPKDTAFSFKKNMGSDQKYNLGGKTFLPEELSGFLVSAIVEDAKEYMGEEIKDVIISVPAYFHDKQRVATKRAGALAGVNVKRIVNEPSAAALASYFDTQNEQLFLVFDFGGGTLDVSIVDCFDTMVDILAVSGDNHLGGDDFNEAVAEGFLREHQLQRGNLSEKEYAILLRQAEKCKIALSTEKEVKMTAVLGGQTYQSVYTNERMMRESSAVWKRIQTVLRRALRDSRVEVEDIDAVILAGGSGKMPLVQSYMEQLFDQTPLVTGFSDQLIARGLGLVCGVMERKDEVRDYILTDICPFTLGTGVNNEADPKHPYMSAIIERNSILPCSKIRGFSTAADYQSEVKIEILQGEEPYAEDNVQLGVVTVAVPKKKKGMESVDVRFTYDINGILEVEVTVVSTGKSVKKVLSQNMDEKELARRMKQLEKLKVHPKDMTENQLILERLQALYEEALPETRDRLMYHIRNFESTLVEQDPRRIRKYREFLEHMIASLEHYDPFEGKLDFPEWSDDDDGET